MNKGVWVAVVVVWLGLWVQHWFPWRLLLRRELPRLAAYVLGVLALALPLSVLLLERGEWDAVWALWAVIVAGGLATVSAYGIDAGLRWLAGLQEELERLEMRHGRTDRGERGQAGPFGDGDGGAGGAAGDDGRGDFADGAGDAEE